MSLGPTRELRLAVLAELKAFPTWLQESRFGPERLDEEAKEKVLSRAVESILGIVEGEGDFRYISLEAKTAAVAALGVFQGVIEPKEEPTVSKKQ